MKALCLMFHSSLASLGRPWIGGIARSTVLVLLCSLLAACPSLGPRAALPPSLERAEALLQRGENADAAREFEALADLASAGDDVAALRLRAARAWLAARRPDDAARLLAVSAPSSAALRSERALLELEIRAARGDASGAWTALNALPLPADRAAQKYYLELKRDFALTTARANEAIATQPALEATLADEGSRRESRRSLLRGLRAAVERGVKLEPQSAARDATLRGWLEIGLIAAQAARGARTGPALASWQARFANHPANDVVGELSGAPTTPIAATPGAHVAVLLPLSGRAGAQANQIRDGLLTAWYGGNDRTELRFYDTAALPVAEALRQANNAGAQFVIGPLLREDVIAAADSNDSRPPLLALNFLPIERTPPSDFYQYALSPEDEARLVARRAVGEGRRRALVLVPGNDWGKRVLAAFSEEMTLAGGTVLGSASYAPGANDHSAAITSILRINDSRARARRIEAIIGSSVNVQPRRRGDIDFILAAGPSAAARQLRPQLRFYYAGDIPTYATSDAYEPNPSANQDLDGVIFPDMPWVLGSNDAVARARAAARNAWGESGGNRGKLFAFGYDAWLIASQLRSSAGAGIAAIEGVTGDLTLDENRRVRRQLDWAQVRGGNARLLGGGNGAQLQR